MIKAIVDKLKWLYYIADDNRFENYLRQKGVRIGKNFMVWTKMQFAIDLTRPWLIEIGDNVEIAAGVTILTHGYDWCVIHHKTGEILGSAGKVKIGNNVFIGTKVTILGGTTIGDNVIIGANSVVKGVLESNSVYVGNPARKAATLDEYIAKRQSKQLEEAVMLTNEYKKVHGEYPEPDKLCEFFWLFEDNLDMLDEAFIGMLKLRGNYEISSEEFQRHKKQFDGYEAFLQYCEHQEEAT